jgi:anti-sigma factor RsiW
VSILNRLSLRRHLDDAALAAIWTERAAPGGGGGAAEAAHLEACAECRVRYAAFAAWLEDVRVEARAEADQAFPPDRLALQQIQITRRLEALERPARVIPFPRFARPIVSEPSGPRRWIAVAAAAGLIVGLGVGQMLDLRHTLDRPGTFSEAGSRTIARNTPAERPPLQPVSSVSSDESLMSEAEGSLPRGLEALDALTPRARDYDQPR